MNKNKAVFAYFERKAKLNLQLFNDGAEGNDDLTPPAGDEGQGGEGDKTFTQADVDKLLQSEGDKRVTDALKKAREKWETELDAKLEHKLSEAERLSKLSEDERKTEQLQSREQELAEREREFALKSMQVTVIDELQKQGVVIDSQLAEMLAEVDADVTNARIKSFVQVFNDSVEKQVNERLKGKAPEASNGGALGGIDNPWETGNYTQQAILTKQNPQLAAQLKAAAGK